MITRRHLLTSTMNAVAIGALGRLLAQPGWAAEGDGVAPAQPGLGYGPMTQDPNKLIDLPAGFSYVVIGQTGEGMTDGLPTPGAPDGMGAFAGKPGQTILVCNHELNPGNDTLGPFGKGMEKIETVQRALLYDAPLGGQIACGGTTTIVYDHAQRKAVRRHLSLGGTSRNCAGGITPWGSWLTCEETADRGTPSRDHGYVFEVPASAQSLVQATALTAMGRFSHEAAAVDPVSGAVYLTEDRGDSCLYRFLPKTKGKLAEGGTLQALCVKDQAGLKTSSSGIASGKPLQVSWLTLNNVESPNDDLRKQAAAAGAATFSRGEGIYTDGAGTFWFCATNGGKAGCGQIWHYKTSPNEGAAAEATQPGTLSLLCESTDPKTLNFADNLCLSPWGDLIVCEDGNRRNRLLGITPQGGIYHLATNAKSGKEWAGCCFSPDGSTLFANLQAEGVTVAITGPWKKKA